MKTPLITSFLITLATSSLALASPSTTSPASADTTVAEAVLAANNRLIEAANRLDTDAFFAGIINSDECRIIQDGKLFKSRAEAMATVRQGSLGIAKLDRRFEAPHVTVLAPDAALLTAEGTTAVELQDGRTLNNRFAVSLVFVFRDGHWLLLHGHYSLPNPPP